MNVIEGDASTIGPRYCGEFDDWAHFSVSGNGELQRILLVMGLSHLPPTVGSPESHGVIRWKPYPDSPNAELAPPPSRLLWPAFLSPACRRSLSALNQALASCFSTAGSWERWSHRPRLRLAAAGIRFTKSPTA